MIRLSRAPFSVWIHYSDRPRLSAWIERVDARPRA
jgi:glutathione S-transferase